MPRYEQARGLLHPLDRWGVTKSLSAPAYITSAEFDPNRDEAITYATRLLRVGVPVELHHWPGTFHGSQGILSAEVSQRQLTELAAVLRRALAE
jgi:acetyl esterase/lipase